MVDFLDNMFGFYINEEEQLRKDFIKDNFCPCNEDPLTYEADVNFSTEDENGDDNYP